MSPPQLTRPLRAGLSEGCSKTPKRPFGSERNGCSCSDWSEIRRLHSALVEADGAAARTKSGYLRSQYARLKGRRGHKKAIGAVAHSILVISYHVLARRTPYKDLGPDYLLLRERSEAYTHRLVRQLERLGHRVTLEPLAATA